MTEEMKCTCKVGPGKFEGEGIETFLAWFWVMEGHSDEETETEGVPVSWFKGPFEFQDNPSMLAEAKDYGYCELCCKEAGKGLAGIAVWEDDQGFVNSRTFETLEEYEKALQEEQELEQSEQEDDTWQVVVGNVGTVYNSSSEEAARRIFREYCEHAKSTTGRVAGEQVTLFKGEDIVEEQEATRDGFEDSYQDDSIPADYPVQPLGLHENPPGKATCGSCGRSWDDSIVTSMTPAPSARCPFEGFHKEEPEVPKRLMGIHVLLVGNVYDGIKVVGYFNNAEEAIEYADLRLRDKHWVTVPLEAPLADGEGIR